MIRIERHHAIDLPLAIKEAFPLFTPLGEMHWVDDWTPRFIHPPDGKTCDGMVFTTGEGDEFTLWSCIEWRPEAHRVRYARVMPASRFAHVAVQCLSLGSGSTRVEVRYELTALNESGSAKLDALTEDAFRASIDGWRHLIETRIIAGGS